MLTNKKAINFLLMAFYRIWIDEGPSGRTDPNGDVDEAKDRWDDGHEGIPTWSDRCQQIKIYDRCIHHVVARYRK
jgi:hypothetical protein